MAMHLRRSRFTTPSPQKSPGIPALTQGRAREVTDAGRASTSVSAIAVEYGLAEDVITPQMLAEEIWRQFFALTTAEDETQARRTRKWVVEAFEGTMDKTLKMNKRLPGGRDPEELTAVSLNEWGHLKVRHADGSTEVLSADYLF